MILLCYRKGTGLELGLKHNGLVFSVPRAAHVGGLVSVPTTPAAMYAAGLDALRVAGCSSTITPPVVNRRDSAMAPSAVSTL